MIFVLGLLAGLLVASAITNVAQYLRARRSIEAALQHEERLLDRAHAAELRAAKQIDAMLDRVSTTPRLQVNSGVGTVDPDVKRYIADTPYMDEAWEEYVGATDESE